MKNARKLTSILVLIAMLFMIAAPAMAATVTVTDTNDTGLLDGHSFTAYQIFTGKYSDTNVLSDVAWGNGIQSTAFMNALKENYSALFGDLNVDANDSAAKVAEKLKTIGSDSTEAKAIAKLAYTYKNADNSISLTDESSEDDAFTTSLDDGYYLIVDSTENVGNGGVYNAALLQVVGDVNITVKTDAPSVEKKVQEDDKYKEDGGYGDGYNDVADYNIGEQVPFKLIGTVPDMGRYDTYKYIFHDTLSKGLTLNSDIKVYVANDKKGTDKQPINNGWSATPTAEGDSLTITFNDLKTVTGVEKGKYIIVEYTATLNKDAEIGLPGNPNTVTLEYSNKPDQSGAGDNNTGETPEDKVIVFTYELDTTKEDGTANADGSHTTLQGAEFKLRNADSKWVIVDSDGKVTDWTDDETKGSTLTSGADGLFKVIGLDDGTYYLKETKAPTGYNTLSSEITLIISAEPKELQNWAGTASEALTALKIKVGDAEPVSGDTGSGIVSNTVQNFSGATLPETGGIGTTIFYVVGAALVVGAGVLLVTKKRMTGQR